VIVVGLKVLTDLEHGGRWTSLSGGGREWLWHRDEPRRASATPGDEFADAGGLEECFPTISGTPDHGEVWARPWVRRGDGVAAVATERYELTRTLTEAAGVVVADYRLAADPGFGFLWAAHALLDLSEQARIVVPEGVSTTVFDNADPIATGPWPAPAGTRLDLLGKPDGSATAATIATGKVTLTDGPDRLTLHLEADTEPISTALWRNLEGWPEAAPYRSVGIEPMLGRAFDLAKAGNGEQARVPASGELVWRLSIWAERD
jgi:hypothetical protein